MAGAGVRVVLREHVLSDGGVIGRIRVLVTLETFRNAGRLVLLTQAGSPAVGKLGVRYGIVLVAAVAARATDRCEPVSSERTVEKNGEPVRSRHVAGLAISIQHVLAMDVVEVAPEHPVSLRDVAAGAKISVALAAECCVSAAFRELLVRVARSRSEAETHHGDGGDEFQLP
jgi:hypothetical protein